MKIIVIKKKALFVIIAIILVACVILGLMLGCRSITTTVPIDEKVIVLDAGHGGVDNGVVGVNGTKESEFNLSMTLRLATLLEEGGFTVVLTRENEDGLYGDVTTNRKRADLEARKTIIQENNPDMVISIHANKYPSTDRRGAQVFYNEFSLSGEDLANCIQTNLNLLNVEYIERDFAALSGDYYLLNCTQAPSVIVECGFLSNEEDEILLTNEDYCQKMGFSIYSGVVAYFETL
jgi:N-acetylmuramoyl-L-alanine amidase